MPPRLPLALALSLTACDDPPPQTCQDWFTETHGFDEHPYFACSLENRACEATPLELGLVFATRAGEPVHHLAVDQPVAVWAELHNPTDTPVAQAWSGCSVSGLNWMGPTVGFNAHYDCFAETTTTVGPGETERFLVELAEQGESEAGVIRAQATFPLDAGACCPCAQVPVVPPPG